MEYNYTNDKEVKALNGLLRITCERESARLSYPVFRVKGGKSPKWAFTGNLSAGADEIKLPSVPSERRKKLD